MKLEETGKKPDASKPTTATSLGSPARPAAPPAGVEYIAEHTIQADETLSHLALKYYGSAVREKWMVIYEANKEAIGDNPNRVRPGTILKIPKLS